MKIFGSTLYALILITGLGAGCKRPIASVDTTQELKKTMAAFLREKVGPDSLKVKYDVKEVTYFEDTSYFECEFIVHMTTQSVDTTGVMRARVSKDFKTVTRKL